MRARTTCILLAALAFAGCGVEDPYNGRPREVRATPTPSPTPTATPAPEQDAAPAATPEQALERVATAYGNWTTKTVEDSVVRARRLTTGTARDELRRQGLALAASVLENGRDLRSRVAVEAVVARGTGDTRRGLVVTRESVTGAGLEDEGRLYKVTLATVTRTADGWLVSEWKRQP